MEWIDTHCHIDGTEFDADRETVIQRAREAGVAKMLVPAIDLASSERIVSLCTQYPDCLYPMVGLHPEEVRADWREQLAAIKSLLAPRTSHLVPRTSHLVPRIIAIGEVKKYAKDLPGGVFHCFTGNALEAAELLQFDRFVLGIGGVLTFKKSHLPEVLPRVVPLDRLVIETDAPYMAPVPCRGQRNEPAYTAHVLQRLAEAYGVTTQEVAETTNANCKRILNITL